MLKSRAVRSQNTAKNIAGTLTGLLTWPSTRPTWQEIAKHWPSSELVMTQTCPKVWVKLVCVCGCVRALFHNWHCTAPLITTRWALITLSILIPVAVISLRGCRLKTVFPLRRLLSLNLSSSQWINCAARPPQHNSHHLSSFIRPPDLRLLWLTGNGTE